jgi:chromosome segregation ATPase
VNHLAMEDLMKQLETARREKSELLSTHTGRLKAMRVELDQSATQVNERDQVIKGLEVDARQLRNQLVEQRREAVASAEGLQQAYAKIALLEGQIRQYKEVSSESAARVAQPDDAQAYRK